ncbi:MAG: DUF308 domain-containing protein [Methanomassiliicoccales archaeon]
MVDKMPNMQTMMLQSAWWALVLVGLFAVIFGLFALLYTTLLIVVTVLLIGIFVLIWGVLYIMVGVAAKSEMKKSWPFYLLGLVGVILGLAMIVNPSFGFQLSMIILGLWAIIIGFMYGAVALAIKEDATARILMLIGAILAIVLGVLFIILPNDSAAAIMWLVGIFAILMGAMAIGMGIFYRPKAVKTAG